MKIPLVSYELDRARCHETLVAIEPFIQCQVICNGSDALALQNPMRYSPEIVFLDVNMPVTNEREFLTYLHQDSQLRNVGVAKCSSKNEDQIQSFRIHRAISIRQPNNFKILPSILKQQRFTLQGQNFSPDLNQMT
jgi:CheY-like chemotaxis protein